MVALAAPWIPTSVETPVRRTTTVGSDLARFVELRTFRQIDELRIVEESDRVVLLGRCKSYYVKQLATHAALEFQPNTCVDNSIDVR